MTAEARTATKAGLIALACALALAAVDARLDKPDETRPHMPAAYSVQADDPPIAPHRYTPNARVRAACRVAVDPAACVERWTRTGELPR